MKYLGVALSSASLASTAALGATGTDANTGKISYDGYKLFQADAPDGLSTLYSQTEALADTVPLQGCSHADHLSFAVPEHELDAFQALGLNATVVEEDLGAAIAAEGPLVPFAGETALGPMICRKLLTTVQPR
jgi:hypothetical protein